MKIVFTDIETTGLNPNVHEIIEIGYVILEEGKKPLYYSSKIKARRLSVADSKALLVNGYDHEEWITARGLNEVINEYIKRTDGAYFCAYNATFDWSFLQNTGALFKLNYHRLDLMSIVFAKTGKVMSLKEACDHFNIEREPAIHRALDGAKKVFSVYQKIKRDCQSL